MGGVEYHPLLLPMFGRDGLCESTTCEEMGALRANGTQGLSAHGYMRHECVELEIGAVVGQGIPQPLLRPFFSCCLMSPVAHFKGDVLSRAWTVSRDRRVSIKDPWRIFP